MNRLSYTIHKLRNPQIPTSDPMAPAFMQPLLIVLAYFMRDASLRRQPSLAPASEHLTCFFLYAVFVPFSWFSLAAVLFFSTVPKLFTGLVSCTGPNRNTGLHRCPSGKRGVEGGLKRRRCKRGLGEKPENAKEMVKKVMKKVIKKVKKGDKKGKVKEVSCGYLRSLGKTRIKRSDLEAISFVRMSLVGLGHLSYGQAHDVKSMLRRLSGPGLQPPSVKRMYASHFQPRAVFA